jgi:hypothetical protein
LKTLREVKDKGEKLPILGEHWLLFHAAACKLRDSMSDAERSAVDFFRQWECHITQDAFEVRWDVKKDRAKVTRSNLDVDVLAEQRAELLDQHAGNIGFAHHIARKVLPDAKALNESYDALRHCWDRKA